MIDWVMPPQTAVALYIYRVGEVLPCKESFYSSKFARTPQFYSESGSTGQSDQPTSQTGVAIAGLATRWPTGQTVEGHWSDRWRQPDQPYAKFWCEHMPPCILVKLVV
jgi:hypothetical protein